MFSDAGTIAAQEAWRKRKCRTFLRSTSSIFDISDVTPICSPVELHSRSVLNPGSSDRNTVFKRLLPCFRCHHICGNPSFLTRNWPGKTAWTTIAGEAENRGSFGDLGDDPSHGNNRDSTDPAIMITAITVQIRMLAQKRTGRSLRLTTPARRQVPFLIPTIGMIAKMIPIHKAMIGCSILVDMSFPLVIIKLMFRKRATQAQKEAR